MQLRPLYLILLSALLLIAGGCRRLNGGESELTGSPPLLPTATVSLPPPLVTSDPLTGENAPEPPTVAVLPTATGTPAATPVASTVSSPVVSPIPTEPFTPTPRATPRARTLFLMGDSWAALIGEYGTVETELLERGLTGVTVEKYGVGGSRASSWAADNPCGGGCPGYFSTLKGAVAADPTSEPTVVIILGGNDVTTQYVAGPGLGFAVFAELEADLAQLVGEIVRARPDATVVLVSYDILNYDMSSACRARMEERLGVTSPEEVFTILSAGQQSQARVANQIDGAVAVNVLGALQGTPGSPVSSQWSPAQFITDDCNHLTAAGYAIYIDAIFDQLEQIGQGPFTP